MLTYPGYTCMKLNLIDCFQRRTACWTRGVIGRSATTNAEEELKRENDECCEKRSSVDATVTSDSKRNSAAARNALEDENRVELLRRLVSCIVLNTVKPSKS